MTKIVTARRTRRELVFSAAVSAGAASALAAVSRPGAAAAQSEQPENDTGLLERTLGVEQLVVIAYRRALASGVLTAPAGRAVRGILGQELVHVATLERALNERGARPPAPPRDLVSAQRGFAVHHMHTSLTNLPTEKACLKLLIDVETVAEAAYFQAIAKLSDTQLLRISAEIMGSEAQHWTVLSSMRHHGDVMISVPYPFVGGST